MLPDRRGGRLRPPLWGKHPPPVSFRLAEKKSAVDGVKEKGALILTSRESPDHSTGPSAALRRQRYCTVLFPRFGALLRWAPAAGARDLRRSGRQHRKAAQVSRAAKSGASAGSASAKNSAETVPRPCAARERQVLRVTAPVNFRGFLGGDILRTVRRPLTIRSDNFIPLSVLLPTFPTWEK